MTNGKPASQPPSRAMGGVPEAGLTDGADLRGSAELRVVPCRIVWCSRPAEDDSDYCIVHAARERAHA